MLQGESLLWFLLRICSERSLEALQRKPDGEVGQFPASLALDLHCGCLCYSWGDLNPYTNIHSGWVLLYWISSSLSPGSRASPFGTIIMSLLVVLQCEWLNAHGCIIYPQEASVSSRGCEFRLERRKLRGSEFLGISCQRLCLSQVFTTPTPTPNCSLRMNQER